MIEQNVLDQWAKLRMADQGSITKLISEARNGDSAAIDAIWRRYYQRLCSLAARKLVGVPKRVEDEEDVVLHAFNSFCAGAIQGRFPRLDDREDLWQILVMLTIRKATDQIKGQCRDKRGGNRVRGESGFLDRPLGEELAGVDQIAGDEPTPEFAAQVAEQCKLLLELLGDESLREVAIAKMNGYSNKEIAARMNVQIRTIERKLRAIREIWSTAEF